MHCSFCMISGQLWTPPRSGHIQGGKSTSSPFAEWHCFPNFSSKQTVAMFQKFINELLEQTHELKGAPYMLTSLSTMTCVFALNEGCLIIFHVNSSTGDHTPTCSLSAFSVSILLPHPFPSETSKWLLLRQCLSGGLPPQQVPPSPPSLHTHTYTSFRDILALIRSAPLLWTLILTAETVIHIQPLTSMEV